MAEQILISVAAEEILKKVISQASDEISLTWGLNEELRKLPNTFATIQEVLRLCTSHEHEKLGPRARKNIFIRYSESSKGYVMYGEHPNGGMTEVESRDIDFIETHFPSIGDANKDLDLYELEEDEVILLSSNKGGELVPRPVIAEDSGSSLQPSGSHYVKMGKKRHPKGGKNDGLRLSLIIGRLTEVGNVKRNKRLLMAVLADVSLAVPLASGRRPSSLSFSSSGRLPSPSFRTALSHGDLAGDRSSDLRFIGSPATNNDICSGCDRPCKCRSPLIYLCSACK
ncbi:hypothetical protein HHK36_020038 [Tetracentron sinense]|uniref:Retroviral polymerase SH3-like domain-containing protein n=1 Tax=Tetracentron sinense TaxID=13715 RepID=A0A834YUT5_TETSI|nr:hypothetical protein HHK36_020038 [Tetracentron sinense]